MKSAKSAVLQPAKPKVQRAPKPLTEKQKAKMRVAVAKDVIAQIELGRLVPRSGVYVSGVEVGGRARVGFLTQTEMRYKDGSVQDVLKKVKRCEVCAKGALFVATIDKFNRLKIGDLTEVAVVAEAIDGWKACPIVVTHTGKIRDPATSISWLFDLEQLNKIEREFENYDRSYNAASSPQRRLRDQKTMIAIMQNIIENGGTFVR